MPLEPIGTRASLTRPRPVLGRVLLIGLAVAGTGRAFAAPPVQLPEASTAVVPTAAGLPPRRTLELVRRWLQPGWYDNVAQTERDLANGVDDRLVHRPMHQFFAPVKLPQFEGYIVFQQASQDGSRSPDSLFRAGLLQFVVDEQLGVVRQRELTFRDPQRFRNAHLDPAALAKVTLDDVSWNPACDFLLKANLQGTEVRGPIPARTCWIESRGLGRRLWADDEVVIRPGEFWFRGRYRDDEGAVKWGNESEELNRLAKSKAPPAAR